MKDLFFARFRFFKGGRSMYTKGREARKASYICGFKKLKIGRISPYSLRLVQGGVNRPCLRKMAELEAVVVRKPKPRGKVRIRLSRRRRN